MWLDLYWGHTWGRFLKEAQRAASLKKKRENVNKSIKLNARAMLRKCHWLFVMGLLSVGGAAACGACYKHMELQKAEDALYHSFTPRTARPKLPVLLWT